MAGKWFSRGLMLDVNEGYLNLAEAVLDLAEGGPLTTEEILSQVGGLGNSPLDLQIFSMNDALNHDPRFDEVGPLNTVLWYLKREEPKEVQNPPDVLVYRPIDYDPDEADAGSGSARSRDRRRVVARAGRPGSSPIKSR